MTSDSDVLIVSAGAAGLPAARELNRLGLTSTLLEGSQRIGRRAYSAEIATGAWFDLGCARLVGGASSPLVTIAEELGIALDKNHSEMFEMARL